MVINKPSEGQRQPTRNMPQRPRPTGTSSSSESRRVVDFIQTLQADLGDLEQYYNISISTRRNERLQRYVAEKIHELEVDFAFADLNHDARVDWLLTHSWSHRRLTDLMAEEARIEKMYSLLRPWSYSLVLMCEQRQDVRPIDPKLAAQTLSIAARNIDILEGKIQEGKVTLPSRDLDKSTAYHAASIVEEMQSHMLEWFNFYNDYDPMFSWWCRQPWEELYPSKFEGLAAAIREHLVGICPGNKDAIIGQPSGRESILADLKHERIAYAPEELIRIGEKEYAWCLKEVIKTSKELGYGPDWRAALDYVRTLHPEPGQQRYLVHDLAKEAVDYIKKCDMVTIPRIADETWRTLMMSPERQKVAPFFLGGESILVSYPTSKMSHEDKTMIMRANSKQFSRSTVFHELIPGHHLQYHYISRYNTHRTSLSSTPFWTEGWSFYWEMILWDRGFPDTPEYKMGMLFWRMHRALRIIFSLKFHLGKMSPQDCIDMLVTDGGHERATAEGEVRRSFNGDWPPLYQAGYGVGALQLYALRRELVETGNMADKEFHDRILKGNSMPIEFVRALLKSEELDADHQPSWRFYDL